METSKITYTDIDQYLRGTLSEQAMHQLERKALDDPFLADAIEGYSNSSNIPDAHLSLLQKQLYERIALQQEKKNVLNFTWQRISIAAAAGLLFISASILFWMKGSLNHRHVGQEKKVDVTLASPDSLKTSTLVVAKDAERHVLIPRLKTPGLINKEKYIKNSPRKEQLRSVNQKRIPGKISLNQIVIESNDGKSVRIFDAKKADQLSIERMSGDSTLFENSFASEPLIGWDGYLIYLRESHISSAMLDQDLKVKISFVVNESGQPERFEILEGLTAAISKEVVRLIKDGPKWKPSTANVQLVLAFKK